MNDGSLNHFAVGECVQDLFLPLYNDLDYIIIVTLISPSLTTDNFSYFFGSTPDLVLCNTSTPFGVQIK